MTVYHMRLELEKLEAQGLGCLEVRMLCDVCEEAPEGECGFGMVADYDRQVLLLDYTSEEDEVVVLEQVEA